MNSQLLTVSMYEPIRYEMFVLQWIELVQVKMHFQVLTNKLLHMFLQNNNTNILFLCFVSAKINENAGMEDDLDENITFDNFDDDDEDDIDDI